MCEGSHTVLLLEDGAEQGQSLTMEFHKNKHWARKSMPVRPVVFGQCWLSQHNATQTVNPIMS